MVVPGTRTVLGVVFFSGSALLPIESSDAASESGCGPFDSLFFVWEREFHFFLSDFLICKDVVTGLSVFSRCDAVQ